MLIQTTRLSWHWHDYAESHTPKLYFHAGSCTDKEVFVKLHCHHASMQMKLAFHKHKQQHYKDSARGFGFLARWVRSAFNCAFMHYRAQRGKDQARRRERREVITASCFKQAEIGEMWQPPTSNFSLILVPVYAHTGTYAKITAFTVSGF